MEKQEQCWIGITDELRSIITSDSLPKNDHRELLHEHLSKHSDDYPLALHIDVHNLIEMLEGGEYHPSDPTCEGCLKMLLAYEQYDLVEEDFGDAADIAIPEYKKFCEVVVKRGKELEEEVAQ